MTTLPLGRDDVSYPMALVSSTGRLAYAYDRVGILLFILRLMRYCAVTRMVFY